MNPESQNPNPLNPGFASCIFSLVLVGLKVAGLIDAPWWVALLPVYFWCAIAAAILLALLGLLIVAVPVVSASLTVGPLIERFVGRRDPDTQTKLTFARPDGDLHDGPLFGYVQIPYGTQWLGPRIWRGTKSNLGKHPLSDHTKFAHAPASTSTSDADDQ